ncbi:hypothetical protein BJX64DRAFT_293203, partial [Aspergillus heterothallicus]
MSKPEEILPLIRNGTPITPLAATTFFNALPPIPASSLLGSWHGTCILTNHPGTKPLLDINWVGKDFHSLEDVDPIIVRAEDTLDTVSRSESEARSGSATEDSRNRNSKAPTTTTMTGRVVNPFMGKARLREVKYNGVVSAAMIYNEKPIIDYFRGVDERTVVGVMDALGA